MEAAAQQVPSNAQACCAAPRGVEPAPRAEIDGALARERQRIAQEIHDHLGHRIALLKLKLQTVASPAPARPAAQFLREVIDELDHMSNDLHDVLYAIRKVDDLCPAQLEPLTQTVKRWEQQVSFAVILNFGDDLTNVSSRIASILATCLDESLANVVKHALTASVVEITLQRKGEVLTLSVRDDGEFFSEGRASNSDETAWRERPRYGLLGLRERLATVGGTLTIEPAIPRGWSVVVRIPVGGSSDEGSGARENHTR